MILTDASQRKAKTLRLSIQRDLSEISGELISQ